MLEVSAKERKETMATNTALIIPADGSPVREVEYADKDSYRTLSAGVGGTITTCPGFTMDAYANDDGWALGLPPNVRVSRAIRSEYSAGIVGDVIIPKLTPTKRAKLAKMGLL